MRFKSNWRMVFIILGILAVLSIMLSFFDCASTMKYRKQLIDVQLKMTKPEVISTLGEPTVVRGAIINKYDQMIEVWEYELYNDQTIFSGKTTYWLYFCNEKLVQWGEPGDWEDEVDRIYEIRFKESTGE